MRKKYLNKKKSRSENKDENSITEEIGSNGHKTIPLDKSEEKMSFPSKTKSEQSSSTISVQNKAEEPNIFSSGEKKDKRMDKRKPKKPNKEEENNIQSIDDFNKQFALFQKKLEAYEVKMNNLEKELKKNKRRKTNS